MDTKVTYIVTGCTGYVGNVLAKRLMSEGATVVGLARSREKVARVFGDAPPRIVYGDVRRPEELEPLPEEVEPLPEEVEPLPEELEPLPEEVEPLPEEVEPLFEV